MKAEILPLNGKYYGTGLLLTTDSGLEYYVNLWNSKGPPSKRELAEWDGDWEFEICDSHYESEETYKLAQTIVRALMEQDNG